MKLLVLVFLCFTGSTLMAQNGFVKHVLTSDFLSEGVAVADINNDGKPDIVAGAFWFEAPGWVRHTIAAPVHYSPATQYSSTFLDFCLDVDQDGWMDVIRIGLPGEDAAWYQNPKGGSGLWPMHPLLSNAGNESPAFVDVDGDGRADLLCNDPVAKQMIWLKSPSTKGDTVWRRYVIGEGGPTGFGQVYAWVGVYRYEWGWPAGCRHYQGMVGTSGRSYEGRLGFSCGGSWRGLFADLCVGCKGGMANRN